LDPYAGFLVRPAQALEIAVRGYLRNSGEFREVIEAVGLIAPDVLLDVYASECFGDFRDPAKPMSVLSLNFTFCNAGQGTAGKTLLRKEYTRSVPLGEKTATAVVAGWDKCLAEIMAAVVRDLAATRQ